MTERIERVIMLTLAACVVVLSFWFKYSYDKIVEDKIEILGYQSQIEELYRESEEQTRRYEQAKERARYEVRQIQEESRKILAAKVPKDCKQAMAWGINEARTFR